MLIEIGSLVVIVKNLLDATNVGFDLFGKQRKTADKRTKELQDRISGIADQLYNSIVLSKMLPIWLKEYESFDLFAEKLSNADVKLLDSRLRQLISDSIHDHFSSTFFRTNFASLPGVELGIKDFRKELVALEGQLNGIPPGDSVSWRRAWSLIKLRMQDLRNEAIKLDNMADQIHSELVAELRQAAQVKK